MLLLIIYAMPGSAIQFQIVKVIDSQLELVELMNSWADTFTDTLDSLLDEYMVDEIVVQGPPSFTERFIKIIHQNYPNIDINSDRVLHNK